MHKGYLRIIIVLIAMLLQVAAAHASDYSGKFFGGKFGVNSSASTGTPKANTFAYGVQGGYLQYGYNWDVRAVTIGVGTYADFNAYERHKDGIGYASRAYGVDAKLGMPLDDWLFYTKIGYGYSTGTRDLSGVAQNRPNVAVGIEYKLISRLGAIVEYKYNAFSNKDDSITIRNRTLSFGLNFYFDRPFISDEAAPAAEIDLGPVIEPDLDIASEPLPDIGSDIASDSTIAVPSDPESWELLLENKSAEIAGSNFVGPTVELQSDSMKDLLDLERFAKKYPDANFLLIGHEDNTGTEDFLQHLSLRRAEAVKFSMVRNGVSEDRITTKGAGSANPAYDNNTPEGRSKNRRVEVFAIFKEQKGAGAAAAASAATPESWNDLLKDKPVRIEGTSFVAGSARLKSKIVKELDTLAGFADKYPDAKLELTGYADSSGSEKSNLKLSLARAESVKKYLAKKGVAAGRIVVRGEGSANPVGDNKTAEGRAKNRRVEIRSITKDKKKDDTPIPVPAPATAADSETWKTLQQGNPVLVNVPRDRLSPRIENTQAGKDLNNIVEFARGHLDTRLELTGYAYSSSEKLNHKLSLTRAESVKRYLVKKGVAADRIVVKAGGSANPVADNRTKEGNAKNQRVEIHSVLIEQNKAAAPESTVPAVPAAIPAPTPAQNPNPDPAADDDPALQ